MRPIGLKNDRAIWAWVGAMSLLLAFCLSWILFRGEKTFFLILCEIFILFIPISLVLYSPILLSHWRKALAFTVSLAASLFLLWLLGPTLLEKVVLRDLFVNVDHRPKPQPGHFNEDGVWPDIPPRDYKPENFVIFILGDSYTEGYRVAPEQAFPAQIEKLLSRRFPENNVRVVNAGWGSSSPVLHHRRLLDIGAKYKPDLVIQALDIGDFHDDLCYLWNISQIQQECKQDKPSIFRAMAIRFGQVFNEPDLPARLMEQFVFTDPLKHETKFIPPFELHDANLLAEHHRFFVMKQPLEKSCNLMMHTWNAVEETYRQAMKIGSKFALFILPRYQHYNPAESPQDPDRRYFPQGDYLFEPFKFFEQKSTDAPFSIHSLLPDFKNSNQSPKTLDDDEHYNKNGHQVAAKAIVDYLIVDGLIPIQPAE